MTVTHLVSDTTTALPIHHARGRHYTVSLVVAGLGLAGRVGGGVLFLGCGSNPHCLPGVVSGWLAIDVPVLGGGAGADPAHFGGLMRSVPTRGCGSSQWCPSVTSPGPAPANDARP